MSYSSEVLADSPWGYWKCDETSGTTLADSSGNARPMTIAAGAPTLAQTGPSGAADAISWPDSGGGTEYYAGTAAAFGTSTVTFEAWVYLTANPSAQTAILACGLAYGTGGTDKYAYIGTDGKVRLYIFNGGQVTVVASSALALNAWHQVIVSVGAAGVKIRVDKSTIGTAANTGSTSGTPKLFIHGGGIDGTGGNAVDVTNSGPVKIAQVSAYTTQLSDARTDAHYDAMLPPSGAGSLSLSASATASAPATATASLSLSGTASGGQPASGTGSLTLSGSASTAAGDTATATLSLTGGLTAAARGSATAHIDLTASAEAAPLYLTDTANRFNGLSMGATARMYVTQAIAEPPAVFYGPKRVEKAVAFPKPTLHKGRPTFVTNVVARDIATDRVLVNGKDITWFRADAPGDTPIAVPGYELTEPFGYGPSEPLVINRTNSNFERYGQGSLAWLHQGARVQYQRVTNDGTVVDYRGIVTVVRPSAREWVAEIAGEVSGRMNLDLKMPPLIRKTFDLGSLVKFAANTFGIHLYPHNGPVTGLTAPNAGGTTWQSEIERLGQLSRTHDSQPRAFMPIVWGEPTFGFQVKDRTTVDFTAYVDGTRINNGLLDDIQEKPTTVYGNGISSKGVRWRNAKIPGFIQGTPAPYPYDNDGTDFGIGTTNADTDTGFGITVLAIHLAWMNYLDDNLSDLTVYTTDMAHAVNRLKQDAGLTQDGVMTHAAWLALWDTAVVGRSPEGARLYPLAEQDRVRNYDISSTGSIIGRNPGKQPGAVRVAVAYDYGNCDKIRAIDHARGVIRDTEGHQWAGQVVLTDIAVFAGDHDETDALDLTAADMMSARDIRPGMNGKIAYFDGDNTLIHFSGVQVSAANDAGQRTITLTGDTGANDIFSLSEALDRNAESKRSPYREWVEANRPWRPSNNFVVHDELFGVSYQDVELVGGHWNIIPVLMGESGTVVQTNLRMSIPTEFCYAVFTKEMHGPAMDSLFGNPFSIDTDGRTIWEQDHLQHFFEQVLLLTVQGQGDQPCGYGWRKGYKPNAAGTGVIRTDNPLTGTVFDRQTWAYTTLRGSLPVVYLAIYPRDHCDILRGDWFEVLEDDAS